MSRTTTARSLMRMIGFGAFAALIMSPLATLAQERDRPRDGDLPRQINELREQLNALMQQRPRDERRPEGDERRREEGRGQEPRREERRPDQQPRRGGFGGNFGDLPEAFRSAMMQGAGRSPQANERHEHMEVAIDHLHAAGLHDIANHVAEQLHSERNGGGEPRRDQRDRGPRDDAWGREADRRMDEMAQMLHQLRQAVEHLEQRTRHSEGVAEAVEQAHAQINELRQHMDRRLNEGQEQLHVVLGEMKRQMSEQRRVSEEQLEQWSQGWKQGLEKRLQQMKMDVQRRSEEMQVQKQMQQRKETLQRRMKERRQADDDDDDDDDDD